MPSIGALYESVVRDSEFIKKNEIAIRAIICHIQGFHEMSEFYIKNSEEILDLALFQSYLARFLNGEPVAYILNETNFLGLNLYVDSRVLIPRMETEEVVNYAISMIGKVYGKQQISIADIGTGSGAIALALKRTLPFANIIATDISELAIEVAKINATKNNFSINFLVGKDLEPLIFNGSKIDILISNPPYISCVREIDSSVLNYEPFNALVDSDDLAVYKSIFKTYRTICNYPFLMVFEIGHDMKEKITQLISKELPKCQCDIIKDINGKDRILSILIEKV